MKLDIVECSFDKHDIRSLVSLADGVLEHWLEDEKFQDWVRHVLDEDKVTADSFDFNKTWWIYHCGDDRPYFQVGFTLDNTGFAVALVEIEL